MNAATKLGFIASIGRALGFRRRRRDDTGASLVEFAIILPVFALMLFGMIQFGLAFGGWDELRNAVQTSARVAVNNGATSSPNCGQPDAGSNLVCQVALSIGAPLDTAPTPLESLTLPESPAGSPEYSCASPLQSCTGPGGGYSWLDGYYIFNAGQWLQIVNPNSPSCAGSSQPTCPPGQIIDSAAFSLGASTWTCVSSGLLCSSIVTNVAGQNQSALGSDNIAINVETTADQLQVCAQRQIVSFTAFPGLQNLHISTTSSFYLTGTASTVLSCPNQPAGQPCVYQSATGVTCG